MSDPPKYEKKTLSTHVVAEAIKRSLRRLGVTGQLDVKMGDVQSTVWLGKPDRNDRMITVIIPENETRKDGKP